MKEILFQYGTVSGYKINMEKSKIMGFNITADTKYAIRDLVAIPWASVVKYLGIKIGIPMSMTLLKELNLNPSTNAVQR